MDVMSRYSSNFRNRRSDVRSDDARRWNPNQGDRMEPEFNGYQLIGDSQFVRFSEQMLNLNRRKSGGLAYIGLCVSGQKISDLLSRVEDDFYPTSNRAVLMIGTNDLLQNTTAHQMRKHMESLVCKLIERGVRKLIILTLPPVPRLEKSVDHWERLHEFNERIKTLHNGEDIFVIDAYPRFVKKSSPRRSSLYSRNDRNSYSDRSSHSDRSFGRSPLLSSDRKLKAESRSGSIESLDLWPKRDAYRSRNSAPENVLRWPKRERSASPCESPPEGWRVKRLSLDYSSSTSSDSIIVNGGSIRISCNVNGTRDVYVTEDESSSESGKSLPVTIKRPAASPSPSDGSPPPKRKSLSNRSYVEDDHDDRFCEEDSASHVSGVADQVNLDYFEEYFSRTTGRKDLIHLNYNGLREIKRLLTAEIQSRLRE